MKKIHVNRLLLALVTIMTITVMMAGAQTPSLQQSPPLVQDKPENAGMSPERLARIDDLLQTAVADNQIPGAVALVARHGKIVYWKAFGMADNQSGRKMKTDDIFRIASQTKAVTSTAVMMLWEQGKFRLDDPISKYIPQFKNPQVLTGFSYSDTSYTTRPASREITIRDLLTHQSGLGYGFIDGDERFKMIYEKAGIIDAFTTENITIAENILKLAQLPLHHDPGAQWTYCEGLDVLGYFIEIISGEPFDVYLKTHIFDPLGMSDTYFYLPEKKADRLVSVEQPTDDGGWERFPVTGYDPDYPIKGAKAFFAGGAGLSSTAKDYATFLQMYLNGGELDGVRLLSRTTVQVMMANQIGNIWGEHPNAYFGLAFEVQTLKGQALGGNGSAGSFSWGGYFNTQYWADPVEGVVGILMKQTQNAPDQTEWKYKILVGQAIDD